MAKSLSSDSRPKDLSSLLRQGKRLDYAKGEIIPTQSDNSAFLILICEGYIKRYQITPEGVESIQSVYGRDGIFPLTPVIKNLFNRDVYEGPEDFYYEAITDVELYRIDIGALIACLDSNQALYKDLLEVAGVRLHSNIQRLENIALKTSHNRVAHHLLFYARKYGKKNPGGIRIDLPVTHQHLASVLSIARETVSREISKLKKDRVIHSVTDSEIIVTDLKKLEKEAFSSHSPE